MIKVIRPPKYDYTKSFPKKITAQRHKVVTFGAELNDAIKLAGGLENFNKKTPAKTTLRKFKMSDGTYVQETFQTKKTVIRD